jgi:hypothetical protein
MNDILTLLKAPFPVDSLSWRIGKKTNWDKQKKCPFNPKEPVKAQMLVYIDARDVQDRLDEVCGYEWSNKLKEVAGRMVCEITINGITKSDGAGDTDFEGEKGGISDSFKRSAVMWGVGRYLYNAKNFNTLIAYGKDDDDYTIVKRAKEEFRGIARQLGSSVQTYHYWLDKIDTLEFDDVDDLNEIVEQARKYAKREEWNMSNIETFKKHVEKRRAELKEKK